MTSFTRESFKKMFMEEMNKLPYGTPWGTITVGDLNNWATLVNKCGYRITLQEFVEDICDTARLDDEVSFSSSDLKRMNKKLLDSQNDIG